MVVAHHMVVHQEDMGVVGVAEAQEDVRFVFEYFAATYLTNVATLLQTEVVHLDGRNQFPLDGAAVAQEAVRVILQFSSSWFLEIPQILFQTEAVQEVVGQVEDQVDVSLTISSCGNY